MECGMEARLEWVQGKKGVGRQRHDGENALET